MNVGNEIYVIDTAITQQGGKIRAKHVEKREAYKKKRWEQQDEDEEYSSKQLDRDIVNQTKLNNNRTLKNNCLKYFLIGKRFQKH